MSMVDFDRLPSWSLVASKTGETTKCSWVGVVESTVSGFTQSRDQDDFPANSTIDVYDLTEKYRGLGIVYFIEKQIKVSYLK